MTALEGGHVVWVAGLEPYLPHNGALPPGEARTVNFPSWDKQQTRYYCRGPEPRNPRAIPFDIRASILRRAIPAAILRPALSSPASDPK